MFCVWIILLIISLYVVMRKWLACIYAQCGIIAIVIGIGIIAAIMFVVIYLL